MENKIRLFEKQLKPCPFCGTAIGDRDNLIALEIYKEGYVSVTCFGCGARITKQIRPDEVTLKTVVDAWNRRV